MKKNRTGVTAKGHRPALSAGKFHGVSLLFSGVAASLLALAGFAHASSGDGLMSSFDFDNGGSGLPAPGWAGSAGSSQQYFQFLDDSLNGPADVDNNPFGEPAFSVNVGSIGQDAWLNPQEEFGPTREDNGGVWEIAEDEWISFSIPVQDTFIGGGALQFFVTAVAFENDFAGFNSFPGFSIQNHVSDDQSFQSGLLEDHAEGEWHYLNWSGSVSAFTGNEITFVLSGIEPGTLALIDSFEAHVIPEPGTYAVLFGVFSLGLIAYRHRIRR